MGNIKIAQAARSEQALLKKVHHNGFVITKKEWCDIIVKDGYLPTESTKNRVRYNRNHFNRLNYAEQEKYMARCNEIVPCFTAKKGSSFYEVSKAEFEYMKESINPATPHQTER